MTTPKKFGLRLEARWVALSLLSLVAPSLLASCAYDESIGKAEEALAHPGWWEIPAETVAIGNPQHVDYTGAGAWRGESACGGGILPGAEVLRGWLREAFPQIASIGGYSCRPIVGNASQMSVHATGRALDVMIPTDGGEADNDLGDPIGNWLIEHDEEIGIQYLIWDRWQWNSSRAAGDKHRMYNGEHPHHDHLHVELSVAASNMETAWFRGSMPLPTTTACIVAAEGSEVEETEPCFSSFGNGTYWRHVTDAGHGGSLLWTNAFENATASNWARWHVDLAEAGNYEVQAWVDPAYGVHHSVRYTVHHDGVDNDITVDQSTSDGWVSLGAFDFAGGGGQHVSVYDNSTAMVDPDQHIAVDAIRIIPTTMAPEPPMPPMDPIIPPMMDGDPTVDDDPMPGEAIVVSSHVEGQCSAAASTGAGAGAGASAAGGGRGPLALLVLAALVTVARRRRR